MYGVRVRRGCQLAALLPLRHSRRGRVSCGQRSVEEGGEGDEFGVFQDIHIKQFPVRSAIDIGTGGMISLCVARVDAAHAALQKLFYQTQLPLYLEPALSAATTTQADLLLSERTITDITNKMRVLHGALRRDAYEGLSERAAVITWPLCLARNAPDVAAALTREFGVDVRVLGVDYTVDPPWQPRQAACEDVDEVRSSSLQVKATHCAPDVAAGSPEDDVDALKALLGSRSVSSQRRRRSRSGKERAPRRRRQYGDTSSAQTGTASVQALQDSMQLLGFLAHAAMAHCVAAERLLVIHESPNRGVWLVGAALDAEAETRDLVIAAGGDADEVARIRAAAAPPPSSHGSCISVRDKCGRVGVGNTDGVTRINGDDASCGEGGVAQLVRHRLPVEVAMAHRLCVVDVQRRDAAAYSLGQTSPNPMLAAEFARLRTILADMIANTLPAWVRRKAALGGVIAGTSVNGGLLNLTARVGQRTSLSLERLEMNAMHHFCGLTDVLLGQNFPQPSLVLPSAALAAGLLNALQTPRVTYIPELTTAAALLTQPALWNYDRRATLRRELRRGSRFHRSAMHRSFYRPHLKYNPTAAPSSSWRSGPSWDGTSYENSLRGT